MDDMARFRALVLGDEALQLQLFAASETEAFLELAVQLATDHGFDITPTEFRWAIQEARTGAIERWTA